MTAEVSISECLSKVSEDNLFYLVHVAAYTAREYGLSPILALERIASGSDIAALEEGFMHSLCSPASQAIETVATTTQTPVDAHDKFGKDMDEDVLLKAMESQMSMSSSPRFPKARYAAAGFEKDQHDEDVAESEDDDFPSDFDPSSSYNDDSDHHEKNN